MAYTAHVKISGCPVICDVLGHQIFHRQAQYWTATRHRLACQFQSGENASEFGRRPQVRECRVCVRMRDRQPHLRKGCKPLQRSRPVAQGRFDFCQPIYDVRAAIQQFQQDRQVLPAHRIVPGVAGLRGGRGFPAILLDP